MSAVGMNECQKKAGLIFRTNENLSSNLKDLISFFLKLGFEIFKPRFEVQTRVVRPTGVYLLDFLLRYSVLFTVESLSLLYLLFISWFICSRR